MKNKNFKEVISKLSDISTFLFGNDKVDEGLVISDIKNDYQKLHDKLETTEPMCPICKEKMRKVNFKGYYDEFSYWECACEKFDGVETTKGNYS